MGLTSTIQERKLLRAALLPALFGRALHAIAVPLVEPLPNPTMSLRDLVSASTHKIYVADGSTGLTRGLAAQGYPVVRHVALTDALWACSGKKGVLQADQAVSFAGTISGVEPIDEELAGALVALLKRAGRNVRQARFATFLGIGRADPFRIVDGLCDEIVTRPRGEGEPHAWGRRSTVFLNAEDASVRLARRHASTTRAVDGTDAYALYRTEEDVSPFDALAVHLPQNPIGDLRRRVLSLASYELVDVTEPIARLQARRARGSSAAPPRLDGAPAHSLLRTTLTALGMTTADGEIELVAGSTSSVWLVREDGVKIAMELHPRCPMRLVYRSDAAYLDVLGELGLAVQRFLRRLVPSLHGLPSFVRDRVRHLVCVALSRGDAVSDEDRSLSIFPTTTNGWLSLDEVIAMGTVHVTNDGPPWLVIERVAPILFASEGEARALGSVVTVLDVTESLRAERRSFERRAMPPLASIELSEETRDVSSDVLVRRGRDRGRDRPPSTGAREGPADRVFTTMRPLTTIPDPDGWPIVAMLNHDTLEPNAGFDGLADPLAASKSTPSSGPCSRGRSRRRCSRSRGAPRPRFVSRHLTCSTRCRRWRTANPSPPSVPSGWSASGRRARRSTSRRSGS